MATLSDKVNEARDNAANRRPEPGKPVDPQAVGREVANAAASTAAKGLVEAFKARVEGREPNYDALDAEQVERGKKPSRSEVTHQVDREVPKGTATLGYQSVSYDARGMVEVYATAELNGEQVELDLPIYIVNPPLFVEDENGDVEVTINEDDKGKPIVHKFREDPVEAMTQIIIEDLVTGGD